MIKISDHSIIIYTDHNANSAIASQIKLSTIRVAVGSGLGQLF